MKRGMVGRARIAFVNSLRADSFDRWLARCADPECDESLEAIGRAANRLGTTASWDGSPLPDYLVLTLLQRLGIEDLNEEALFRLQAVIFGFYKGAWEALRKVNLSA
ncbi:MAG: hypothetical protein HY320_05980 [Armatimonadetes bacterium]|nr:hypothetical protein [Armatimonadota bacterium]